MLKYNNRTFCSYYEEQHYVNKTYAQALHQALKIATLIQLKTTKSKQKIAIIGSTTYQWVSSYLGILLSGNIAVPIDYQLSQKLIQQRLKFIQPTLTLVTDTATTTMLHPEKSNILIKVQDVSNLKIDENQFQNNENNLADIAEIVFTSGTNGQPHAVMLSNESILKNIDFINTTRELKTKEKMYTFLPNHHIFFLTSFLLTSLQNGHELFLSHNYFNFQQDLKNFKPTQILTVPRGVINFKRLIERQVPQIERLEQKRSGDIQKYENIIEQARACLGGNVYRICSGGATLNNSLKILFKNLGIQLFNGYGMTECGPVISLGIGQQDTSVGIINKYCKIKIKDREILVKGKILMWGYYREAKLTNSKIVNGWFKTGDLGYISDNHLYLTGRKKNLIILSNGENVSPEDLEDKLLACKEIEACVICEINDRIVAKIWAPNANKNIILDYIKTLNQSLLLFERITKPIFMKHDFSRTTSGKIIRK